MKRILSLLLAIIMVFGMFPLTAFAEEKATKIELTSDAEELKVGDKFSVTATLSGNPGYASLKLALDWNESVVKFTGFSEKWDEDDEEMKLESIISSPTVNHAGGIITASRANNSGKNGILFVANFEVIGEGEAKISLKKDSDSFVFANAGGEDISVSFDETAISNLFVTDVPATIPVEGINIVEETAEVFTGETLQLTAKVLPDDADNKNVIWSSSDNSVATVDEQGIVSGVKKGVVTITATTEEGGFFDSCVVTVNCAHINKEHFDASESDCFKTGWKEHWVCGDCGTYFDMELNEVDEDEVYISYTDHKWNVSYEWSDNYSKCTATRVCENNDQHEANNQETAVETANATITSEILVNATCENKGTTKYIAKFDVDWADEQTETVEDIGATKHNWDETSYVWSADNKKCTATRVCKNDESHVETASANVTPKEVKKPTCEGKGETEYTATFTKDWAKEQTKTVEDIDAIKHKWGGINYSWSSDGKECEASRVCQNDASHVETEEATITSERATDPTCTAKGTTEYTAKFTVTWAEEVTKTVPDVAIDPDAHKWGEVSYVWSEDNSDCTATRVCELNHEHVESETVETKDKVIEGSTCTEKGSTKYTATFTKDWAREQTKTVEDIDATDHDWNDVTYTWSADNKKCTATRVCKNDETHVESETVDVTSKEVKEPTCEGKGETEYTAIFTKDWAKNQTKTIADIDAIKHNWEEPSYVWSADNKKCTATRVCKNDGKHVETEIVDTIDDVVKEPTCEGKGKTKYTATFTKDWAKEQTKTVEDIDAIKHNWDEISYVWSADNKECTATRVCKNDESHVETASANVTSKEVKKPTCEGKGETEYTATFTKDWAKDQTKTVEDIDAIKHNWGGTNYSWSSDGKECEASRVCQNDASHVETEEATITYERATDPTCTAKGTTEYTAKFTVAWAEEVAKTVPDVAIDPNAHKWGEVSYVWSEDNSDCTATRVCELNHEHVESETVETEDEVIEGSTCTGNGSTKYTATFTKGWATEQTKTLEDINAPGHLWGDATYEWNEDHSKYTAKRVCKNDASHFETAEATVTSKVVKEPTCSEVGDTEYTAKFGVDWAENATEVVTGNVPAVPSKHDWNAPEYSWNENNTEVTATRICKHNANHVETETVSVIKKVVKDPTCEGKGETKYTADFAADWAETQTKTLADIDSIGHDWKGTTYSWNEDYTKCTAKRVCKNDGKHVETETVNAAEEVIKESTCEESGESKYFADFAKDWAEDQTETKPTKALEHKWGAWEVIKAATTKAEGLKERVCERCSKPEQEIIPKIKKPADGKVPGITEIGPEKAEGEFNPNTGAPARPVAIIAAIGVAMVIGKKIK